MLSYIVADKDRAVRISKNKGANGKSTFTAELLGKITNCVLQTRELEGKANTVFSGPAGNHGHFLAQVFQKSLK